MKRVASQGWDLLAHGTCANVHHAPPSPRGGGSMAPTIYVGSQAEGIRRQRKACEHVSEIGDFSFLNVSHASHSSIH